MTRFALGNKHPRVFLFIQTGRMNEIKIKKHIRSKDENDGINDYIESLESYLENLKASNTNQLIFKLDELNGTIVEDIDKILSGEHIEHLVIDGEVHEVSKLKLLNDSNQSKTFDRVMALFGKLKDLKAVSDLVATMIPTIEEKESVKSKIKIDKGRNMLEQVSDQLRGKG